MRRRNSPAESLSHEFELDLAPLLAVMVKLVPVLIVSSAFVPVVIIQSELPAPVSAMVNELNKDAVPQLELTINQASGIELKLSKGGKELSTVHLNYPKSSTDLGELKSNLVRFKKQEPQLFRLDLIPQGGVPYEMLIKIIDVARKGPNSSDIFKFKNPNSGITEETNYMYPEVVFANILEG